MLRDFERALVLAFCGAPAIDSEKAMFCADRHMRIERIGLEHHGDAPLRRRHVGDVDARR